MNPSLLHITPKLKWGIWTWSCP